MNQNDRTNTSDGTPQRRSVPDRRTGKPTDSTTQHHITYADERADRLILLDRESDAYLTGPVMDNRASTTTTGFAVGGLTVFAGALLFGTAALLDGAVAAMQRGAPLLNAGETAFITAGVLISFVFFGCLLALAPLWGERR